MASRWLPARALPAYAYVPGRAAHPTRDPQGHSHGAIETDAAELPSAAWRQHTRYLWGIDLYNEGYVWEAHEAWEGLWLVAGDPVQRGFLQGLIQCAAACVKVAAAEPTAAAKLAGRGCARLDDAPTPFMGLDVAAFAAAFRGFVAAPIVTLDMRPRLILG